MFLVSADFNGKPDVFVVQVGDTISIKNTPAMGLKATETATLKFSNTPALRLGATDFDYTAFLDLGNLMWCAMAVGTCEAVKHIVLNMPMSERLSENQFHIVKVSHS